MTHQNASNASASSNANHSAAPFIPKVVRDFHHLLTAASSRREVNPYRRLRRLKLAGRVMGIADVYAQDMMLATIPANHAANRKDGR